MRYAGLVRSLGLYLAFFMMADTYLTEVGLSLGLSEANPITAWLIERGLHYVKVLVSLFIATSSLYIHSRVRESQAQRIAVAVRALTVLMAVASAVYTHAVVHNVLVVFR